jgi:hypothetical protein
MTKSKWTYNDIPDQSGRVALVSEIIHSET